MTPRPALIAALAALTLGALNLGSAAQAGVPAPKVSISDYAQLKTPLPYPYDEAATPEATDAAVAKAKAQAKKSGKLLLIDLGGNWCGDCRVLAGTLDLPEMHKFVDKHYVEVIVDVGRFNKNLQVPAHYGITERLEGVPSLLLVDPKTDKLLNAGNVSHLADARHMTPQSLADYLAQYAK
ncbi:thioredoxin family protein [Phenylobacterium aquaticum]|uniref:thioredoxin family protein n=1 Tax=Phenylobacterium aquaticum TaxID=1763816 RepID=UPI0026ED2163|nr:thioredoxin family protein [Phenylobacterium aquaticum]